MESMVAVPSASSQRKLVALVLFCAFILAVASGAKEVPRQVIVWPSSSSPVLRFTFSKFKEIGSERGRHTYVIDTTAENLSSKAIPNAYFYVYVFDKDNVRIGEGSISLSNVGPGQTVKFQTTLDATGTLASLSIVAASQVPKVISITVNSVPQGASIRLDGTDAGNTPKIVKVSPGKHILQFSKEGYNTGTFPLEIGADDVSGGSVSYELGNSAHDTIELRDGSVLNGDLDSVSGMDVVVRIGGNLQHFSRNQIKRILLAEREAPPQ